MLQARKQWYFHYTMVLKPSSAAQTIRKTPLSHQIYDPGPYPRFVGVEPWKMYSREIFLHLLPKMTS